MRCRRRIGMRNGCAATGVQTLESRSLLSTITVTSLADNLNVDGEVTLREAIRAANEDTSVDGSVAGNGADRIVFEPGLTGAVTLARPLGSLVITDSVKISGHGRNVTTVEGSDPQRDIFVVPGDAVSGAEVRLERMRIRSGGIAVHVWLRDGLLVVDDARIRNNKQGIRTRSDIQVSNTEFFSNGNKRHDGAAIEVEGTDTRQLNAKLVGLDVVQNVALVNGGCSGVFTRYAIVDIQRSVFRDNYSDSVGGGLCASNSHVTIANSTFSGNEIGGTRGSAIWVIASHPFGSSLTLEHSTVTQNHGDGFSDHRTDDRGAVTVAGHEAIVVHIANSVIAGNTFRTDDKPDVSLSSAAQSVIEHTLIGDHTGSGLVPNGGVADADGNLVGSPDSLLDPQLLPLTDNGGGTMTHLPEPGSRVIDAGTQTAVPQTDQRGGGFGRVVGSAVDLGAVEVQSDFVRLEDRILTILGTNLGDSIALTETGSQLDITWNDEERSWGRDEYDKIVIQSMAGDDLIDTADVTTAVLVEADDGNDTVVAGSGDDTIQGGAGDDNLEGRGGSDEVRGGGGDDALSGGGDADTLTGGSGSDTLDGNSGADSIRGAGGADLLRGGPGTDTMRGGGGDDRLVGGDANDLLNGGSGADVLRGSQGDDLLVGNKGADDLDGGSGNDILDGGAGDDLLGGAAGRDILLGNNGADDLFGGDGDDILIAGTTSETQGLSAIMAEWTSARSYAQRTENILMGPGEQNALNAPIYLIGRSQPTNSTVFDDAPAVDKLTGDAGLDLFFAMRTADQLLDQSLDETVEEI